MSVKTRAESIVDGLRLSARPTTLPGLYHEKEYRQHHGSTLLMKYQ